MSGRTLCLGLVQQKSDASYEQNVAHSFAAIRKAATAGAKLIVLPELHTRPYFCQVEDNRYFEWAETIPGPTTESFSHLAKELKVVIVVSIFEKRSAGLYHNTAVVIEQDGSIAGLYRKMHIPHDPDYYEKYYFAPGDLGFMPIKTSLGSLGVLVCWDQWFPEAARLLALRGAEILVIPTAIGWDPRDSLDEKERQRDAWETIQRAHAIANHVPLAVCNRVGFEESKKGPGILFWGSSFVSDTMGKIMAKANADSSAVLVTTLDLEDRLRAHQVWPFLRDRRIDAYEGLLKLYS